MSITPDKGVLTTVSTAPRPSVMLSPVIAGWLIAALSMGVATRGEPAPSGAAPAASPGGTTYRVDPENGDDTNPTGQPWKTYGKLNSAKLAPGDKVVIAPGLQEETLKPMGGGTAEKPVVIHFLPGIHTIGIRNATRVSMFVSNSMDSDAPKPVGILIEAFKHLRLEGGGVDGDGKTTILYDGRMVQLCNDHSEDVVFTGLVLALLRFQWVGER